MDSFGHLIEVHEGLESPGDPGVLGDVEAETAKAPDEARGSLALTEFIISLIAWAYNLPTCAQPSTDSQ